MSEIFTSNFQKSAGHPKAVAICRGVPRSYKGRRYMALAPTRKLLDFWRVGKPTEAEWTKVYCEQILAKLDPKKTLKHLGDGAVLVCWEKEGEYCHRSIVANWLTNNTGVKVTETDYAAPSQSKRGKKGNLTETGRKESAGEDLMDKIDVAVTRYSEYPEECGEAHKIRLYILDLMKRVPSVEWNEWLSDRRKNLEAANARHKKHCGVV